MSWSDLTDRGAVLQAVAEYEELGREAFLARYGFGHATKYLLVHEGKEYDAKAIIGAAHGHQFPDKGPLSSADFASSARTVKKKLAGLGFEVRDLGGVEFEAGDTNPTRPRLTVIASSDFKNWEIGRDAGVWGVRKKASAALAKGRSLRHGDRIAVYISGRGLVAFVEVTGIPQEPWPQGEPDPWQDGSEYQLRIPIRLVQEFDPPIAFKFDGAFAKSLRIDKLSLLGWGNLDEYQVERIHEIARGDVTVDTDTPLMRAWFFVHVANSDNYRDKEGRAYHFPLKIANAKQIDPGDLAICYRTASAKTGDAQKIFGIGRVGRLQDDQEKHRYAIYDKYLRLDEPIGLDEVGGDPRPNWSHSISSFPPDRLRKFLELVGIESLEELPDVGEVHIDVVEPPKLNEKVEVNDVVSSFRDALEHSGLSFGARHDLVTRDFVVSLLTKPFVILTGLSGSGKTRIAQHFGEWLGRERSLIAAVRPDWSGAEALFGYEDALDQSPNRSWFVPPVLAFMLKAARDPEWPYLLVLDEMNLAHVERYFGDFLSGLETGYEVLPNLFRDEAAPNSGRWRRRPELAEHIPIPPNLFVVGTVNVDETTYMFSPKVLDRANTFEFRVATDQLDPAIAKPTPTTTTTEALRKGFLEIARNERFHESRPASFQAEFAQRLIQLHGVLAEGDYEYGHRVMFEGVRFAALNEAAGGDLAETLDLQVLQKILPKLHGSFKRLAPTLQRVAYFAHSPDGNFSADFDPLDRDPAEAFLPLSFAKARRMYRNLKAYQFTSFTD